MPVSNTTAPSAPPRLMSVLNSRAAFTPTWMTRYDSTPALSMRRIVMMDWMVAVLSSAPVEVSDTRMDWMPASRPLAIRAEDSGTNTLLIVFKKSLPLDTFWRPLTTCLFRAAISWAASLSACPAALCAPPTSSCRQAATLAAVPGPTMTCTCASTWTPKTPSSALIWSICTAAGSLTSSRTRVMQLLTMRMFSFPPANCKMLWAICSLLM